MDKHYGEELVLDLHDCNQGRFNRKDIQQFLEELCDLIKMKRVVLHFWDYEDDPEAYEAAPEHLKGTSVVQFIQTSNITIHVLDDLKKVFLNIFSCKSFDPALVASFAASFFGGRIAEKCHIRRH